MAKIIPFASAEAPSETGTTPGSRSYMVEISAHPNDYLEFTAKGVRTDAKSLYKIAAELEKIASIIRSDVISEINCPA